MIFQDLGKVVYGAVVLSKDKNLSKVLIRKYTSTPLCRKEPKTQGIKACIHLLRLIALKVRSIQGTRRSRPRNLT